MGEAYELFFELLQASVVDYNYNTKTLDSLAFMTHFLDEKRSFRPVPSKIFSTSVPTILRFLYCS